MDDKTLTETWAWLDDDFKLDADSHLVISGSLWEDFAQDEVVVRSLFPSTSSSFDSESNPSAFCSEISDSTQSTMSWDELGARPLKRRRVLHGDELESFFQSYEESQGHESSARLWPVTNEESNSSVDDAATEPSAESWMVGCFSDSDTSDAQFVPPRPSCSARISLNAAPGPITDRVSGPVGLAVANNKKQQVPPIPAAPLQHQSGKTNAGKVQVKRSATIEKPDGSNSKKSSNPVVLAYPFALVKPSGLHGDVTLQDINKRIKMGPPARSAPTTKKPKETRAAAAIPPRKPVLGLTRIHTEGRGTITIMRTRRS